MVDYPWLPHRGRSKMNDSMLCNAVRKGNLLEKDVNLSHAEHLMCQAHLKLPRILILIASRFFNLQRFIQVIDKTLDNKGHNGFETYFKP